MIAAAPAEDQQAVDQEPVEDSAVRSRMDLGVRAGPCIPHGLSQAALPAPAEGLALAPRAPVLAPALVLVRLALAWAVQVA